MEKKSKLAIFDLDGTLFDTKNVNFVSYRKAISMCGLKASVDYQYYCDYCNGNHYKVFLPKIISGITTEQMQKIHEKKKIIYSENLNLAVKNQHLFSIICLIRSEYLIALVTTASKKNTKDILNYFKVENLFDLIITQEHVNKTKPDPEGFIKAMDKMEVNVENTIIFEDSKIGLEAAEKSGAKYVKVYGYN